MRLDKKERQRLDALLDQWSASQMSMPADQVEGMLVAVCCSPRQIETDQWMRAVWFGREQAVFSSQEEASDIIEALLRLQLELEALLNLQRLASTRSVQRNCSGWCEGFLVGMNLDPTAWSGCLESIRQPLATIFSLTGKGREMLESDAREALDNPDGQRRASELAIAAAREIFQFNLT
jgi:yecA family protein